VVFPPGKQMAAHSNAQAQGLYRQSANDKRRALDRVGEQNKRCQSKKKSGRHHEQSGVLHGVPFQVPAEAAWAAQCAAARRISTELKIRAADRFFRERQAVEPVPIVNAARCCGSGSVGCAAVAARKTDRSALLIPSSKGVPPSHHFAKMNIKLGAVRK